MYLIRKALVDAMLAKKPVLIGNHPFQIVIEQVYTDAIVVKGDHTIPLAAIERFTTNNLGEMIIWLKVEPVYDFYTFSQRHLDTVATNDPGQVASELAFHHGIDADGVEWQPLKKWWETAS